MAGDTEDNLELSWLATYYDSPPGSLDQYSTCLYWAIMTMSTIGYGDVTGKTMTERLVACLCMFFGAGTYGYVIGSITSTVAMLDHDTTRFHETMDSLNI